MPLCGTKLSSFGIVVSAWGAAQLSLIGLLLHFRSVAFVEDLRLPKQRYDSAEEFFSDLNSRYDQSAINCWTAALIYVGTFCVSSLTYYLNVRTKEVPLEPLENFASINT